MSLLQLQAGSSIMPGKVDPVVPELVMQLSFRVRGCAHTVDLAGSLGGYVELAGQQGYAAAEAARRAGPDG